MTSEAPPDVDTAAHSVSLVERAADQAQPTLDRLVSDPPPDGPLTHYTSQVGALGILSNGEIWATHPQYLNDDQEIEYARQVWQQALLRVRYEWDAPDRKTPRDYIADIDTLHVLLFGWAPGDEDPLIPSNRQIYVACFTTQPDQLSQWRGYGSGAGPAYSLSLNSSQLPDFRPLRTRPDEPDAVEVDDNCQVQLVRVKYPSRSRAFEPVKEALDLFCTDLIPGGASLGEQVRRAHLVSAAAHIRETMAITAPSLKNPGFDEEAEWRLVVTQDEDDDPPLFRATSTGLAPYKKLVNSCQPGSQSAITRIKQNLHLSGVTQGPHAAGKLGLEAMNRVLDTYGYDIAYRDRDVKQSRTSLRQ